MKSLEFARDASRYIGNTAKEISGIGRTQRVYREEKKYGGALALVYGAIGGMSTVGTPIFAKVLDSDVEPSDFAFVRLGVDAVVNGFMAWYTFAWGHYESGAIARIDYSTFVQIAPDVARLAKGRVFQRAK